MDALLQEIPKGSKLVYPDGQAVTCLEQGTDRNGAYLIVEHKINRKGVVNGSHWHPNLTESFTVIEGKMRFVIDGEETVVGPGRKLTIAPGQVHQFWNESEGPLIAHHEIRPPGLHWQMFALIHKLECEGKLNRQGIPRNPLWLGLAWESMEGYLAGVPTIVQKLLFGGLARLAKAFGYSIR